MGLKVVKEKMYVCNSKVSKKSLSKVANLKLIQKIFLRNPKRYTKEDEKSFISPANGKIVGIIDTSSKSLELPKGIFGHIDLLTSDIAQNCYVICIMMTVKDIHIQRVPLDGVVIKKTYKQGEFRNVVKNASDLRWINNEKLETIIHSNKYNFDYKVVQVAGLLAKRINSYVDPGCFVKRGEDLGHITLGSQVTLVIPKTNNMKINIKMGQKVIDGETIVAYIEK